jgi:hypothetical protein
MPQYTTIMRTMSAFATAVTVFASEWHLSVVAASVLPLLSLMQSLNASVLKSLWRNVPKMPRPPTTSETRRRTQLSEEKTRVIRRLRVTEPMKPARDMSVINVKTAAKTSRAICALWSRLSLWFTADRIDQPRFDSMRAEDARTHSIHSNPRDWQDRESGLRLETRINMTRHTYGNKSVAGGGEARHDEYAKAHRQL